MSTKFVLGLITALGTAVLSSTAFAEGAVKVDCFGQCNLVNLGQVCDTFAVGAQPVAVACDDTTPGGGINVACGAGLTCRPFGSIVRGDLVSSYCSDGPGFDAIVTCRAPVALSAQAAASPKLDDSVDPDPIK